MNNQGFLEHEVYCERCREHVSIIAGEHHCSECGLDFTAGIYKSTHIKNIIKEEENE